MSFLSKYGVVFASKEARSGLDDSVVTRAGEQYCVVECEGGWVEATSRLVMNRSEAFPSDLKLWDSAEAAEQFMSAWNGHPWYAVPESWEVLKVVPAAEWKIVAYARAAATASRHCGTATHILKTDPQPFEEVRLGHKRFEIRFDDRDYNVGDTLDLRETVDAGAVMQKGAPLQYTGRMVTVRVLHIMRGPIYGLAPGWVIMSIDEPVPF